MPYCSPPPARSAAAAAATDLLRRRFQGRSSWRSSWIQFVSVQASFMKFRWFVLEKRTPYEACVEPYQHVAPRGATGSRAFTRVFIFSVSPAPLFKAPRAPEGIVESTATHGGPQGQRHSASRPRRARSSPPRQLDANASRPPAPPGSNATRLQRHQAPTPPGSSATRLQRHLARGSG